MSEAEQLHDAGRTDAGQMDAGRTDACRMDAGQVEPTVAPAVAAESAASADRTVAAESASSAVESTESTDPTAPTPTPPPLPGQYFVRPGIDDRPDYEKVLSEQDKAAVARLATPLRRRAPEAAAAQAGTQAARLSDASPATAAAAVDTAIPDMASAFLDMRDPMVAADGTRPDARQVRRLTWGFALAALLRTIPWAMITVVLLPLLADRIHRTAHPVDGTRPVLDVACLLDWQSARVGVAAVVPLAVLAVIGVAVSLIANAVVSVVSDHTRTGCGRRTPWMLGGGALCAFSSLMLDHVAGWVPVVFFWMLLNIGYAMLATPLAAAYAERMPDKFRERSMRWRGVALMVGRALGVLLAAIGVLDSGRTPFVMCALLFVACAIVPVLVLPRERSSREQPKQRFDGESVAAQFRMPAGAPAFRRAFAARLVMMTGVGLTSVFLWLVVVYRVALPPVCSGDGIWTATGRAAMIMPLLAAATLAGSALASLLAGRLVDRIDETRRVIVPACILYAMAALLPMVLTSTVGFVLFALVTGFAFGLIDVFHQRLVMETLPDPRTSGHDLGVFNLANVAAPALAAILGAALAMAFGYLALFAAAAIAVLAAAALTAVNR